MAHWDSVTVGDELADLDTRIEEMQALVAVKSANLYNPENTIPNCQIKSTGELDSSTSYSVTELFRVPGGKKIYMSGELISSTGTRIHSSVCRLNAVYNQNGELIYRNTTQGTAGSYTNSSEDTVFVRFQLWGSGATYACTDYYVIVVDASVSPSYSIYEPFGMRLNSTILTSNEQTFTTAQKTQIQTNIGVDEIKTSLESLFSTTPCDYRLFTNHKHIWTDGQKVSSVNFACTDLLDGYPNIVSVKLESDTYRFSLSYYGANGDILDGTGFIDNTSTSSNAIQNIPLDAKKIVINISKIDQTTSFSDNDIMSAAAELIIYRTTDESLSYSGCAADAKSVGDAIDDTVENVKNYIDNISNIEHITFTPNYYVITNSNPVDLTPVDSPNGYSYAIVDCQSGDKFTIKGSGGSSTALLWCFIGAENAQLTHSAGSATLNNGVITAPEGAEKLIVNINSAGGYAIKGVLQSDQITQLESNVNSLTNKLESLGVNNVGTINEWVQGRISTSNGAINTSSQASYFTNCRVEQYLRFTGDSNVLTLAESGYTLDLIGYEEDAWKTHDSSLDRSTTTSLSIPDKSKYYRLNIKRTDNAEFTPDDIPDDIVVVTSTWQTDDTLKIPGKIADSAAVGAAIDQTIKTIADITGLEPLPVTKGYYTTALNKANVFVDGQVKLKKSSSGWSCAIIDCQEGDIFTIKGTGGRSQLLWCYIDSEGNSLLKANKYESLNMEKIPDAPENAVQLICNANSNGLFVARGEINFSGNSGDGGSSVRDFFKNEVTDTVNKILSHSDNICYSTCIITDTHWHSEQSKAQRWVNDTLANVKAVNDKVYVDSISHLGDLLQTSDENISQSECDRIMNHIQCGLRAANERVHMVPGNHDGFHGDGPSTPAQNYSWMSKFNERYVVRNGIDPYFYVDIEKPKLRLIYLATSTYVPNSNPTPEYPYFMINGVLDDQLTWFGQTALNVDDGRDVIIFSHISPYMSGFWRNRISIRGLCNAFNAHESYDVYHYGSGTSEPNIDVKGAFLYTANFTSLQSSRIIVWQFGHAHHDRIAHCSASGVTFPMVCTLCSWLQNLGTGTLPDDYTTKAQRTDETVTQDAWDTMIYRPDEECIYYIRFGAGADRILHYNTISISEAYTLTPSITPVTWTSTNEDQATVANGEVTPHAAGTATIYAEAEDGTREYWFLIVP